MTIKDKGKNAQFYYSSAKFHKNPDNLQNNFQEIRFFPTALF